ncbi:hypothetical protein ACQV5M_18780, partial [Leptospira sp. SA-E8]|uniref:hypothetical protein n=1 Tax=Leptospira sp. SA-E8 TaxID=3422259 RepID=UPI003EB8ED2A
RDFSASIPQPSDQLLGIKIEFAWTNSPCVGKFRLVRPHKLLHCATRVKSAYLEGLRAGSICSRNTECLMTLKVGIFSTRKFPRF